MSKISTHRVRVGGHMVPYKVAGAGEPIVLVHGLCGSTLWWVRNVQTLAQHYRVYLVDLPGFGAMRRVRSRFQIKQAAQWLVAWMQAIGLKQAHLVGHSMGGYICMWIAAHHPDVVSRLVLVSPAVMPRVRSVYGYLLPLLRSSCYIFPRFWPILTYDALRAGPLTLLQAVQDLLLLQDVSTEMQAITAPTLLIWGEDDALVPLPLGQIVREKMPHTRLLVLKRAGHVSMFDRPREFNTATLAFLRGEIIGE